MARVNAWSTLVRLRIAADAAGTLAMLRGSACLGAGLLMAAHAALWARGAASLRVDRWAKPAPLSPPLARIIGAATATLALAATTGALGRSALLRAAGGWSFASAMVAIQVARLVADRVRQRVHVGL